VIFCANADGGSLLCGKEREYAGRMLSSFYFFDLWNANVCVNIAVSGRGEWCLWCRA
jgi:hypothetical protein